MYNNPYVRGYNGNFNQQNMFEQIDTQISQLQQMKEQMKNNQQPAINQTFQLAPTNNHTMRYADTIDDVNKETVYYDTPYFSKDMSVLWIKNVKGDIKTYELNEIIPKDDKDIQIEYLKAQIEELKKGMVKDEPDTNVDEPITNTDESEKPKNVQTVSKSNKKAK